VTRHGSTRPPLAEQSVLPPQNRIHRRVARITSFDTKLSAAGALSHEKLMRSLDLYGNKVIPLVRELLNAASSAAPEGSRVSP
jgi:hypothetical protein